MNSDKRKLAIITGASSGIGLEFAFLLAEQSDYHLVLVARRNDRLERIKSEIISRFPEKVVHCLPSDLTKVSDRDMLWESVLALNQDLALLINNAGYGSFGYFKDSDLNKELQMIELNCTSIVDLSHRALQLMVPTNFGSIINVSSMASFQGLPYLATYSSTKAFVTSFSLGLSEEVRRYGIKIQALCPGPVATEFGQVAGFPDKISITSSLSARTVALRSLKALEKEQVICIPGTSNFVLSQLNRLIPKALASKIASLVLKSKFDSAGI